MLKNAIKWGTWVVSIAVLVYVGTGIWMFYHICTTTVHKTPWGIVDTDTAKIGFMEYWGHSPCYEAHREIIGEDTIRYYFYVERKIYYKAYRGSSGLIQIRLYYPDNKEEGEVCTDYFRKEDIFIK